MLKLTLVEAQMMMETEVKFSDKAIATFKKRFEEDPGTALDWSQDLFEKVATKLEAERILFVLRKKNADLDNVTTRLTDMVLRDAKYISRSTSVTGNLWEESRKAARASLLDQLTVKED